MGSHGVVHGSGNGHPSVISFELNPIKGEASFDLSQIAKAKGPGVPLVDHLLDDRRGPCGCRDDSHLRLGGAVRDLYQDRVVTLVYDLHLGDECRSSCCAPCRHGQQRQCD
jgi:hypothetical protein